MAQVTITPDALGQVESLPLTIQGRVRRLVTRLEKWPEVSGAKPLGGGLAGSYRLRTGDYRLRFRVDGEMVIIDRVGHRDGFYDD